MAKVRYIDHDGAADEVKIFGVVFKDGEVTEVSNDVAIRLFGNRYFEAADKETASENDDVTLEAVHRGRGTYAIISGDKVVKDGLSKEDSEAFNAMSDEDKAEYVN
ncbi:hypothetical protein [Rhizobium tumorigenes]|uniref:Uncharacterized protein n=1 Tax=Rhizobium tumorigenes TaxID=2041385 RepID=A0AAF1KAU9_9HYPH|nr:hypothetical protein [Rhizobium tumorigenes]WFR98714.1 hypothetical protein PR017_23730 [Rhizobium tumorigenes]